MAGVGGKNGSRTSRPVAFPEQVRSVVVALQRGMDTHFGWLAAVDAPAEMAMPRVAPRMAMNFFMVPLRPSSHAAALTTGEAEETRCGAAGRQARDRNTEPGHPPFTPMRATNDGTTI